MPAHEQHEVQSIPVHPSNLIEVIESGALGEKDGNKDAASPLIGTKAPQPMVGTLDSTAAGRRRPPSLQVPRRQQAARGADSPLSPPCWSPASPGGAGIARSYSINSVASPGRCFSRAMALCTHLSDSPFIAASHPRNCLEYFGPNIPDAEAGPRPHHHCVGPHEPSRSSSER